MKPNWKIRVDGRNLSNNELINKALYLRGVEDIYEFLSPSRKHIHDSSCFKNIGPAANLFISTIRNRSNILIYADVDVDGCTSAAIIYHYLRNFDITPKVHINTGKVHGIPKDFDTSLLAGIDLVIIVDSLNSEWEIYQKILQLGTQIIVLDHHVPKQEILEHQTDIHLVSSANDYLNPHLSGSGVCWKFVSFVDTLLNTSYSEELVDLASVGIIADASSMMSMENRAICNIGFDYITNPGLLTMLEKDTMCSSDVGYSIAPLVNAANRVNDNETALRVFLSTDTSEIKALLAKLHEDKESQKIELEKFMPLLDQQAEQQTGKCLYIFLPSCGTLSGLLATRAVDKYGKPTIVIGTETDTSYKGSMRATGVEDFSDLVNSSGVATCSGHENSAGIEISKEHFSQFKEYIDTTLSDYVFDSSVNVDARINTYQITPFLLARIAEVNRLSGHNFPSFRVVIDGITEYDTKPLSKGKHLSVQIPGLKCLYWNLPSWDDVHLGGEFSAVGVLSESTFAGKISTQLVMDDFLFDKHKETLW